MELPTKKSALLGLSLVLLCVVFGILIVLFRPDTPILLPEDGAIWIYIDRPFIAEAQREGEQVTYRKRFRVEQAPSTAMLTVRALRVSDVFLDDRRVPPVTSSLSRWKGTESVDMSGLLAPGIHEIAIRVFNENGPAVLLAYCESVGFSTGPGWQASYDELLWTRAVPADRKKTFELAQQFSTSDEAFISLLPVYAPVFLAVFLLTLAGSTSGRWSDRIRKFVPAPSGVRWLLIALWALLAANNILKIPLDVGMDVQQHYEYIEYVANLWRIPLATQGWQMFQSPLYYIVSALVWNFPLSKWFDIDTAMMMLRIIPLLCGLLQVQLAYVAARTVFPLRQDLQIWGTVVGGLLPMNLYISQAVGNEPLSGLLSACAVVIGFVLIASQREVFPEKYFLLLGAALGLALLTKATAVLLIPLAVALVVYVLWRRQQRAQYIVVRVLLVVGIIAAIAGWYYLRNWIELGRPFVGGWGSSWWQDPGYRTLADFESFGSSLRAPIYSAIQGFWDSLYSTFWLDGGLSGTGKYAFRPPWHYDFMISGALLSFVPAAGILVGILVTLRRATDRAYRAQLFSVCCIAVYFAAVVYMYVTLPIWTTAKATYALGLLPCYAVLCITGFDVLSRNNLMRATVNAALACWAVAAYCSYFVL